MPARNIVIGQMVNPEKIARAKELRREMTPDEKVIWERLRANRFHSLRFRRQQVIDGYIADFYCHAAAVVVEIDGPVHEEQVDYDHTRDQAFRARGLTVLRITNDEVRGDIESRMTRIAVGCGKV
jgi:very-short-patch-repair endonuclease